MRVSCLLERRHGQSLFAWSRFANFQLKDAYVACKHSSVLSCVAGLSLYVTMLP